MLVQWPALFESVVAKGKYFEHGGLQSLSTFFESLGVIMVVRLFFSTESQNSPVYALKKNSFLRHFFRDPPAWRERI